jgi:hypothetical protein
VGDAAAIGNHVDFTPSPTLPRQGGGRTFERILAVRFIHEKKPGDPAFSQNYVSSQDVTADDLSRNAEENYREPP